MRSPVDGRSVRRAGGRPSALGRGRLPLYVQCAHLLRRRVETGEWPVGGRLPSLETMAGECAVAVVTIRQAVQMLEEEGLVERRQGLGTFVVGSVQPRNWLSLGTSWSSLLELLEDVTVRRLKVKDREAAPVLQSGDGKLADRYRFQKRVHCRGNEPFCIIELHLAHDVYLRAPKQFDTQLVLTTMTRLTPELIKQAWQTMTIGKADPEVAHELGIDAGDPVAFVRRVINDGQGRVVYFANITYRADFVRLDIDLVGRRRRPSGNSGRG